MRARGAVLVGARSMLRDAHAQQDPEPLSIARALRRGAALDRGADLLAAHRRDRASCCSTPPPRPTPTSTRLRIVGLVESDWPERSARSIFYPQSLLGTARLACASRIACRRRARGSRICCACRATGSRCRRSRSKTTRSCRRRRCSRTSTRSAFRSSGWCRAGAEPALARVSSTRRLRSIAVARGGARRRAAGQWLALRRRARFDAPRFRGITGRARAGRLCRQPARALPRVPVQVLRGARPAAAGGARRGSVDDAAGARPLRPRRVRDASSREWQRLGPRRDHDGERRRGARAVRRGGRAARLARCPKGTARSSGRCCSARPPPPASASAPSRSRSRTTSRSSSGCSSIELEGHVHVHRAGRRPRQVALRSKADRIDLLADGTLRIVDYKTRPRAGKEALAAAADLRRLRAAGARAAVTGARGRSSRAGYIAFKEKTPFVELQNPAKALAEGEARS